jgi:hypothetical protein
METESEFGKGLTYCIGLFLAHTERFKETKEIYKKISFSEDAAEMWFNAASDHCYELQIPDNLSATLKEKLENWKDKCLKWGHGYIDDGKATEEDVTWSIKEAKELLRLIDMEHGVETIAASWD